MTFSPPTEQHPVSEPLTAPVAHASSTLAVISLVLGIIAFLTGWVPCLGLILGIGAVVLGAISLVRRQGKGFSITGIILGSIAALVSIGATIFLIVGLANWNTGLFAPLEESGEPTPAAEALTAEELSQFLEVDDTTLMQIMDDPASHLAKTLIIYGSMGEPLILTGADGEGLCVMEFSPSATADTNPGVDPLATRAVGIGDGTLYECPMLDSFAVPDADSLSGKKKMWVIVSGETMPREGYDGDTTDAAVFAVVQTE
ncbi:DUF4190 domain-containing protein [Homoserinimonas sp. OAct 916]|uniref:DUF4190 domain-containing protein n=1 Tax=Homoserinimonas sp. OAct 916 TaxID=2211450 RepID=UPI000DBE2D60|nr:DUF4190 domain-containing protein [Homoserinimonas sp. OAct 916]